MPQMNLYGIFNLEYFALNCGAYLNIIIHIMTSSLGSSLATTFSRCPKRHDCIRSQQGCSHYRFRWYVAFRLATSSSLTHTSSLGGATDTPYNKFTGAAYGTQIANWADEKYLDGVDFDLENFGSGFRAGCTSSHLPITSSILTLPY